MGFYGFKGFYAQRVIHKNAIYASNTLILLNLLYLTIVRNIITSTIFTQFITVNVDGESEKETFE